jgi:phosphatidate cytidylyltransferase
VIGNTIRGPKIFQSISPNKTFSGSFGGIACGYLVGIHLGFSWKQSLVIACAAQVGDFVESAAKRIANVKDSNIGYIKIPGHGGILDRIDALIFAAPVALLASKYI